MTKIIMAKHRYQKMNVGTDKSLNVTKKLIMVKNAGG